MCILYVINEDANSWLGLMLSLMLLRQVLRHFLSDVQKVGNGELGCKGGWIVLRTASAGFMDRRGNLKTT